MQKERKKNERDDGNGNPAEAKENLLKREASVLIKTKFELLPEDFLVSSKENYAVYFVFI